MSENDRCPHCGAPPLHWEHGDTYEQARLAGRRGHDCTPRRTK